MRKGQERWERLAPAVVVLAMAGCSGHPPPTPPSPEPSGILVVTNRSTWDMDVFLRRDASRDWLGIAPNGKTTSFYLSPGEVVGPSQIRFQAAPIAGGRGNEVTTEPVVVQPNDTITFDIPPP